MMKPCTLYIPTCDTADSHVTPMLKKIASNSIQYTTILFFDVAKAIQISKTNELYHMQ